MNGKTTLLSILVDKWVNIIHSMGMARCIWIYGEADEKVKSGLRKVGDQCGSDRGKPETRDLCHGHYLSWCKKNKPEVNIARIAKEKATKAKSRAKINERHEEVEENIKTVARAAGVAVAGNKNPYGIDENVLKAMGLLDRCNLEQEYVLYKQLNLDAKQENYDEKMAYFRWQSTPEPWREPQDIAEVGKILGVSVNTLALWRKSIEYEVFEKRDIDRIVNALKRPILYKIAEAAYRGDKGMTEIFNKYYVKKTEENDNGNVKFPQISPEQVAEANKRAEEQGKERLRSMPMKLEKTHIMGAARDGFLIPNAEDKVN